MVLAGLAVAFRFFFDRGDNRDTDVVLFGFLFCYEVGLLGCEAHPLLFVTFPNGLSFLFLEILSRNSFGLRLWLYNFLAICSILYMLSMRVHRVPIPWVDTWMENAHDTHFLYLHKREKWSFLELSLTECLPKVVSIFVKIDDASVHVDQHSHDGPNSKFVTPGLLPLPPVVLYGALCIEISSPLPLSKDVSCMEVKAPDILLP